MPSNQPCFFHYRVNKFINREQGLCYVKGHDLGGTVEPSLFIEKELSGAGGGFDGVGWCGVEGGGDCVESYLCRKSRGLLLTVWVMCVHVCEVALNSGEKSC